MKRLTKLATANILPRLSILMLASMMLFGCGITPPANWQPTQVNRVSEAKAWELKGKIAVKTPEQKFSTNLYWLHTPQSEELRLTSMIGSTLMLLKSDVNSATLELDGKSYQGDNASELLQHLSGWQIPISQLPQWIVGLPGNANIVQHNADGLPQLLVDSRQLPPWHISYKSWQALQTNTLPRLLTLERGQLSLKIQLNEWQALTEKRPQRISQ
ncbi:lipoprotein insertase outer membrane protein LolB [Shewanella mangrovi]|uniref:lipoprotein insertase outer membrane protein LolB n=1 Tax=Shewanella mangrovi TaxID=1515746 RepID=UPI0012E06C58|nr:lipoprotein insertase outer membrane protein LolB [Shewanella mangrovi]